jgi:undecaprenyl-diphosphatase
MNELQALLLGVIQGLTEFLPISSSGHLVIAPWLLDFRYLQEHESFNRTFDVALHVGTLVAVLVYFREELRKLARAAVVTIRKRKAESESERLAVLLSLATLPAVVFGALGEGFIEGRLGEPWQIALCLAVFGLALGAADRLPERRGMTDLRWRGALLIGFAQAAALVPGVSRSGITITAARTLNLTRDAAARFSFLLLVPVVAGASVFEGLGVVRDGLPAGSAGPVAVGVVAAAVSGFAAIWGLLRYVRTRNYDVFILYRLGIAAAIALVIATGLRSATF